MDKRDKDMLRKVCMDHVFSCRERGCLLFVCMCDLCTHIGVCSSLCMHVCEMFEPESCVSVCVCVWWGGAT